MARTQPSPPVTPAALELRIEAVTDVVIHRTAARQTKRGTVPEKTRTGVYAEGTLFWGSASFTARSGPWQKGSITDGVYTVKPRHAVADPKVMGKDDVLTDKPHPGMTVTVSAPGQDGRMQTRTVGFFIPFAPDRKGTGRGGLGIHPDGNVPGTAGCIGIDADDAARFWDEWKSTPVSSRPVNLNVSGISGKAPAGADWTDRKAGKE